MAQDPELHVEEVIYNAAVERVDFIELPLHRLAFVSIGGVALVIGLIVTSRLTMLNVGSGDFYKARATANVERHMNIPASRGGIVDRHGIALVRNERIFSALLDVREFFKKNNNEREQTLSNIDASIIEGDEESMRERLRGLNFERESYIMIEQGIDAQGAIALRGLNDPAIIVRDDDRRAYLFSDIFAHTVGYTGKSTYGSTIEGKTGIEAMYDHDLRGQDGLLITAHDAHGNILEKRIAKETVQGSTVKTTLDAELQKYIYGRLRRGLEALGRDAGVVIALKPKTGEVLSLVNIPSYDPNVFTLANKNKERAKFLHAAKTPLFNRAISGRYSPGSTIKPLMGLAALHEQIMQPTDEFFSSGVLELPNPYDPQNPSKFLDWKAHGYVNLYSALARSSNIYFYIIGGGFKDIVGLGIARIKAYWDRLGFNEQTGIDLPGESDGMLLNQTDWEKRFNRPWRVGNTYNTSIGQGDMIVTPIRLLTFINSIGAGGKMFRPFIVKEIVDIGGRVVQEKEPELLIDYADEFAQELEEVQRGLRDAARMPYGTAHTLNDLPMTASGKTGSAQINYNTKVNAFFVGYAPSEDPEIGLLVLVEDAKEGSINTLPIARDIFDWYYEHRISKQKE